MDVTLKTPAKQAKSAEADYQNKDTIVIRFGVIASILHLVKDEMLVIQ